jgi:uncharacterized membrane protein YsdA (DUF1294 family)
MTALEIYLVIAPIVLLLAGTVGAWLGPKWIEHAAKKAERRAR